MSYQPDLVHKDKSLIMLLSELNTSNQTSVMHPKPSEPAPSVAPRPPYLRLLWRLRTAPSVAPPQCAFCGISVASPQCAFCGASAVRLLWRLRSAPSVAPPHCAFCGVSALRLLWRLHPTHSLAPPHCAFCGVSALRLLWRLRTVPSVAPPHFRSCSAREITLHRFTFNVTFIDKTFKTITQYFRS